ncbi:DUF2892 domain-containing protein [Gemmatimonas sp.]|jgi:hypothetical protein|uniref:YgaP family membrane protein n=1 Tax=Gemmatimonas sp. TaxID=1962908 RepID=UPI0037C1111F
MWYRKNVPATERVVRVALGVAVAGAATWVWGVGAGRTTLFVLSGVMLAATGFVGFCPMCALVGRKLGDG